MLEPFTSNSPFLSKVRKKTKQNKNTYFRRFFFSPFFFFLSCLSHLFLQIQTQHKSGSSELTIETHPALAAYKVQPKARTRGELVTIRLFVSSTFVDTHGERDILIKKVLPALNKALEDRDVQIVPVDLR